jgi:hypothetical protein
LGHLLGTRQTDQKGKGNAHGQKIMLSAAIILSTVLRSRPVLLYVTAANRRLSDVYRMAGSGCKR